MKDENITNVDEVNRALQLNLIGIKNSILTLRTRLYF